MTTDRRRLMYAGRERKDEVLRSVLFADPGLGGTGWAIFPEVPTAGTAKRAKPPTQSGVIRAPQNEQWQNAAWSIAAAFAGVIAATRPQDVVLEMPELWAGDAKSHASMTHKAHDGEPADLCKLLFLVGALAHVSRERTGNLPILVSPQDWKGQLPKDAVIARVERALGPDWRVLDGNWRPVKVRDHEADAIGMGVAAQGLL